MWENRTRDGGGGNSPISSHLQESGPLPIAKHTRTPQRMRDSEKLVIETNRGGKGKKNGGATREREWELVVYRENPELA